MATDLQTFALAFALVWGGLAAYLLWLHRRIQQAETLQRR